jgi:hypothetical protein
MAVRITASQPITFETNTSLFRSCTFGLSIISFILSQAIPIFNYILALTGSLCFAPLTIILTGCLWLDMHKTWRNGTMLQRGAFYIHILIPLLGAFMCVGGTYAVIQQIITAYADGTVGKWSLCLLYGNLFSDIR